MPTFGISNEDCESDGRYGGHSDLLLKRLSFRTLQPFETIRSTEVHTLLSKTLRDLQSCASEESISPHKCLNKAVKADFSSQVTRIQSPFKSNTQTHEEIAEYYLRKASTDSEQNAPKEFIEPAHGISRLLQQSNFSTSLSKPFINTPLICAKSLPASSGTSNESFAFLGTPTLPAIVPEPLKEFPHLNDYNGSRPSFGVGTTTSTPYTKKFTVTAQIQKSEEHRHDNSAHLILESKLTKQDTTTRLTNSLEDCYAVDIRLAEKYDEAKKRMEKSKEQKALRILTKRTVVEKVTVESKKTASTQEIHAVSGFLCKLLTGQPVAGYGNKVIQLTDSDLVWYGMIVTIESYTGVVERDPSLAVIISRILVMISCTVPNFESVLLGKLLSASHLLILNEEKCTSFAVHLTSIEDRRFALIPETIIIKLFFYLHFIGSKHSKVKRFTSEALWKVVHFLTDEKPRVLATAMMLSEIVVSGVSYMREMCPHKWSQFLSKIGDSLLPNLEKEVNKDDLRRSIGEDTIVSGLRHAVLRHLSS